MVKESGHRLEGIMAVFLCASLLMGSLAFMPLGAKAFPENATLQGYVTDGSNPVPNAYVKTMMMLGNGVEINKTYTNISGFYSMGVPGGLQYVMFVIEGSYELNLVYASVSPGETKWVNFTLTPIAEPTDVMLMGYVHDEFGNPRSDGVVFGAVAAPGGNGAPSYGNLTVPNATGYYEVNITAAPNGGGAIGMDFPGYPMAENMTKDPLLAGMSYWFNITLRPEVFNDTGTLSGVITEYDTGVPLENVIISIEVDQGMGDRYANLTITNSSGMYSMGIRDGNARVMIQKVGYSMKIFDNYMLNPGPNVLDVELLLTEAKIRGNVTDLSTMTPMVNARLFLSDNQGNMSMAFTNESGFYELDAFVGTGLYLVAEQDDYSREYVNLNISSGDELWVDFGLWPATAWLVGSVTDLSTSDPIPNANLHFMSPMFETWANADPGGHYNITLVAGNYTVEAYAPDYWPFMAEGVTVLDGVETVFDIAMTVFENANLHGNVTDQITGAPVVGANVEVGTWFYHNNSMTDSEGNYSMALSGGDYSVWVNAPSYQSYSGMVHVDNYSDTVFNIVLMPQMPPTTVLLKGNVTESGTGDPVPWGTVRVHFPDRSYQNQTNANETGYYEMYVPPWAIEVTAWGPGHGPTFASTNVSGMSEYVLDLQLPVDGMQPQLLSFNVTPQQNISVLNPTSIDVVVDEAFLKDLNLILVKEWNTSGTNSNYTLTHAWSTSYDPLNPRNELNPSMMGSIYSVHLGWDTSGSGAVIINSTDSIYLPCSLFWDGSRNLIMLRGFYSNSTVTDVSGTAIFDFDTHALLFFWTDLGFQITMPDATGVLKPVATFIEFSGGSVIHWFENRVVAEMPVTDLACNFLGVAPSDYYKAVFIASDWSTGSAAILDMVVDNTPPMASAGPDQSVIENSTVSLDASASTDNWWIDSYSWSYVNAYNETVTMNGAVVSCAFNSTGTYDIRLEVSDGAGWVTIDYVTITVGPDMPPTADAGDDIWTDEDLLVSFDGSGSSDDLGIVNYTWSIVELGVSMYDATPTYTFAAPSVYNVELIVTDTIGQTSAVDALVITVNDTTSPTADAGSPQWVNFGSSVTLNASGSGDNVGIVNYSWSFTDGVYIELYGLEVSHSFGAPGTYVVTLTVADAVGQKANDTVTIVVNGYPTADAGIDQLVNVGSIVTFDGSGSSDDIDLISALNLTWTFTYNAALRTVWGASPIYTFSIAGQYTVTLTVTDTMGLSDTDTMTLTVNAPPSANAGPDQTVDEGATVTFNGALSTDDLDSLAQLNLTWTFTYDGSARTLWEQAPTFNFVVPGTYTVTLTVIDTSVLGDTDTMTVTVDDITPPTAEAGSSQSVNIGSSVTLNGSGSGDNVGIVSYTWSFTDGVYTELYGLEVTHTFSAPGTYVVTLTVADAAGLTASDTVTVVVNGYPAADAGIDQPVNVGSVVTFDGSGSSDDIDLLTSLNLTWTFTYDSAARTVWGASPTYTFSIAGQYTVTLTVIDTMGLSDTDTMTVTVNDPPTAVAGPDQPVNSGAVVIFDGSGSSDDIDSIATLNLTWNFTYAGSPVVLYGSAPTFTFVQGGVYNVWLTVRDTGGLTDVDYVDITVNMAPVARAGADQNVNVGATVTFNASATTDDMDPSAALNYTWTFTYSSVLRNLWGIEVSFLFNEPSSYIVTLTVTDSSSQSSTDSLLVNVNGPPTANAGPDQGILAGESVTFDGSMSNDDAGSTALNYTWNFTVGSTPVTIYGVHPEQLFVAEGTYTVTLTVRDAGGLTSTDTMTVLVEAANAAPIADAGDDQAAETGDIVVFEGGDSTDDAGTAGLNYTWEFLYDGQTRRLYGPQPTFEFEVAGEYTVTLSVRDGGGLTDTDTVVITIEDGEEAKSFISQYWWSLALIVVAAVVIVALLLMKRKGSGGSKADEESSEEVEEKAPPPPDEEEL